MLFFSLTNRLRSSCPWAYRVYLCRLGYWVKSTVWEIPAGLFSHLGTVQAPNFFKAPLPGKMQPSLWRPVYSLRGCPLSFITTSAVHRRTAVRPNFCLSLSKRQCLVALSAVNHLFVLNICSRQACALRVPPLCAFVSDYSRHTPKSKISFPRVSSDLVLQVLAPPPLPFQPCLRLIPGILKTVPFSRVKTWG